MADAITKTVSLLLLILIGYLFSGRIKGKEQKEGIRTLILSLALPATIFIALLKIDFIPELVIIPVLALLFNIFIYGLISRLPLRSLFQMRENQYRSLILIIPSLAPGLSCFPFILEYSGEGTLAMAALADLGNKVFVLIVTYILAMKWYLKANQEFTGDRKLNIKDVLTSLVNEPVNLIVVAAILMLSLGIGYDAFPVWLRSGIDKISLMMTPLVLLFIGISIKFTWLQMRTIFAFLFFRASIAFLVSAALLFVISPGDMATALLIVVFPQSACSFWPYAHMAAVNDLEQKHQQGSLTFDLDFAMNILACSLPFSVMLIMMMYTLQPTFTSPLNILGFAALFFLLAAVPAIVPAYRSKSLLEDESA